MVGQKLVYLKKHSNGKGSFSPKEGFIRKILPFSLPSLKGGDKLTIFCQVEKDAGCWRVTHTCFCKNKWHSCPCKVYYIHIHGHREKSGDMYNKNGYFPIITVFMWMSKEYFLNFAEKQKQSSIGCTGVWGPRARRPHFCKIQCWRCFLLRCQGQKHWSGVCGASVTFHSTRRLDFFEQWHWPIINLFSK